MVLPLPSRWCWIFVPAVMPDRCEIDQELLNARVRLVAKIALSCFAAAFVMTTLAAQFSCSWLVKLSSYLMPLSILPMYIIPTIDSAYAAHVANIKAVNEYLSKSDPSPSCILYLQTHLAALTLLDKQKGDLNKKNLLAFVLRDECTLPGRWEIFKFLIDHGADLFKDAEVFSKNIDLAVANRDPSYLEYVLQQKKITPTDFSPQDQHHFWISFGNKKTAALLKEYGFDIEAIDEFGRTPAQRLHATLETEADKEITSQRLAALLQYGAKLGSKPDS